MQSHFFLRRYYEIHKDTGTLVVKDKPDGKVDHSDKLTEKLLKVDTDLNTFLKPDYAQHFKDNVKKLQLPKDNPLPFALYMNKKLHILWAATDADYDLWTENLINYQKLPQESPVPSIDQNRSNRFVTSMLAALKNEPIAGGANNESSQPR